MFGCRVIALHGSMFGCRLIGLHDWNCLMGCRWLDYMIPKQCTDGIACLDVG